MNDLVKTRVKKKFFLSQNRLHCTDPDVAPLQDVPAAEDRKGASIHGFRYTAPVLIIGGIQKNITYSAIDYSMPLQQKVPAKKQPARVPDKISPARKTVAKKEAPRTTTIQVSGTTKTDLDRVKREADASTYEDAIRFLLHERKKHRPSAFGVLAGGASFVRDEEEDSYRIRH
jgi:hypothetical protein